jgi:hypothetical protein
MTAKKHNPRNAGRKKGIPNKTNREVRERAAAAGILPLDYMLQVMRDNHQPDERRDDMAKAAAPYLHSKMPQAVTLSGDPAKPLTMVHRGMTPQEAAQAYAETLKQG